MSKYHDFSGEYGKTILVQFKCLVLVTGIKIQSIKFIEKKNFCHNSSRETEYITEQQFVSEKTAVPARIPEDLRYLC